ncbi:MAG: ATP-binding protein [Pyrinomonadaceae bacterium]
MSSVTIDQITFPVNPLDKAILNQEIQRRTVKGILESYNSNYDVLAELVQNSVDAIEDAYLCNLPEPYLIQVRVNLQDNWISILDTGVGMTSAQAVEAFAPSASFKADNQINQKRGKYTYRGYKGVGLTFLAYGTDDILLHTKKQDGDLTKGRMQYALSWANGERSEPALIVEDESQSPLDSYERGTYIKVQLSPKTRPKKLSLLSAHPETWGVILRTRTAIGQITLSQEPLLDIEVSLTVTDSGGELHKFTIDSTFLLPHLVQRQPDFRFLNVPAYYAKHSETTDIPVESLRQDGVFLVWDKDRIYSELTKEQKSDFANELEKYNPVLYAFFPYSSILWTQINQELAGGVSRRFLSPGLIIGVNRQRLADVFDIEPTRYTNLAPSLFTLVHFDNAKPDQGRKTVQEEVIDLAKRAADRALQYIAKQRLFLKPAGDAPTPGQREVEKNHQDWLFNVQLHARSKPLNIPPLTYQSEPLSEQDVIGLFHQLSAKGVFPGLQVFATSQSETYDSLIKYDCPKNTTGLQYRASDDNPLGVTPYILGDKEAFDTRYLTLEFKNNLDALVNELGGRPDADTRKDFSHIDICVCWGVINIHSFRGYTIEEITKHNLEERKYPGVTHLLRRDGDAHIIQIIMLQRVVEMISTGRISIA